MRGTGARGPKGGSSGPRGLLSDPPEASDTSRATQSGGRNGQANKSFPSSKSLLPNIGICWKMDVKYCPKEPRLRLGNTRPRVQASPRALLLCLILPLPGFWAAAWRRGVRRAESDACHLGVAVAPVPALKDALRCQHKPCGSGGSPGARSEPLGTKSPCWCRNL